ncbi:AMP-binding protein [Achromobacter sp. GG226]|uniref:AMP-binding protein n=1 Tax=Verticiella alkaliphila TaxID=2779529 RepID=UPI001C0BF85E|nr:AMP-binding protein [Verticiella sp. GG226]MBU4610163.1 AMP-binding protein [Verticiella sp. GG226]
MTALQTWARERPDDTALYLLDTTGVAQTRTWRELDERSARIARWLVDQGLQAGENVGILMENNLALFDIAWAARRAGLYYTPINIHLTAAEAAYVLSDCGAKRVFTTAAMAPLAREIAALREDDAIPTYSVGEPVPGLPALEDALVDVDVTVPLPERALGRDLLYSSGTTGLPKGIKRALVPFADRHKEEPEMTSWKKSYGFSRDTVYLSPAPFYHAAPLRYLMRTTEIGGVGVALRKFDARVALKAIQDFRVTHSQWVPTMFVRLLDLPEDERRTYDLSSLRVAIHAAAPCPVHVKRAIIDWFGPVVYEYYGGSETVGLTAIDSQDWLRHPGSVGRAILGQLHIVDEEGNELGVDEVGTIYFSGGPRFEYHNDPEKTRKAYNDKGWATYGDIGHVDANGYLYMSDRRVDLILSGGVNIYPAEIEGALMQHEAVDDAAVIGAPDAEFGESVLAVIQLQPGVVGDEAMAEALAAHCREHLAGMKVPRRFVFDHPLPRLESGKLLRRRLKDHFRTNAPGGFAVRRNKAAA